MLKSTLDNGMPRALPTTELRVAGSLASDLLHRSLENSGKHGYRRAFVNHYMSAESLLPYYLAILIHTAGNPEAIADMLEELIRRRPKPAG